MTGDMLPLRPYVDPGWEHGTAQDDKKKKVKCNYCGKVVSGGIYRLKQHLARVSGEVTYCERAPEEVYLKMRENLEACRSNKKPKVSENDEHAYLSFQSHEDDDDDDDDEMERMGYKSKGKKVMCDKSMLLNWAPLRSLGYVDPGWEHGVAQDERKKKVKCNYCGKVVSGGINRFKQHLARIPGEVAPCKNAPDEVYLKIKENMKWHRTGRRQRRPDVNDTSFYMHSDDEPEEDEPEDGTQYHLSKDRTVTGDRNDFRRGFSGTSSGSCSDTYLKSTRNSNALKTFMTQTPVTYKLGSSSASEKNHKEVISSICEFFYYAGVPMHAANSLYFQRMLDLVGQYGQGLVSPSSRLISGCYLQDELSTVRNYLAEYKTCWEVTGCSILADTWRNAQGRTMINLTVSCPRGVYFVSLVDATDIVDDPPSLFKLLDNVVDKVGEENVVQVVTQNTPSYKAAGKMIEDKWKHIFWTPCATYCIDRVLEDFAKIKLVRECIESAQKVTRFIYNRVWLLKLMKKEFTGGQDILRPALTRHAAGFLSLQSILDNRNGLKSMFQSNKWLLCRFSKSNEGKEVEKTILNSSFWKKMQYVQKSVGPVVQAVQKVYSDGILSMTYIYNEICEAKLAIKSIHGDDARKYGPFCCAIDNHWNALNHHPLCVAAYFLNPAYRYRSDCVANPELMRGLNQCLVRLEPDDERRVSTSTQVSDFLSAEAEFGTELAINTRTKLDPAVWWQQHGTGCLELQRIAVRILSQTCSSFGCEHNWSFYEQVHFQKDNALAKKKLDDLLYVHYNLRLRECQIRQSNELISLDNVLLEGLLDDWVMDTKKHAIPDDDDKDIIDHEDGYDYDILDYEDGNSDMKRGSLEVMTLAEAEPFEVHANAGPATDDEADLDFLDDGLSD